MAALVTAQRAVDAQRAAQEAHHAAVQASVRKAHERNAELRRMREAGKIIDDDDRTSGASGNRGGEGD